jgi:hypothetical protein
MGPANAQLSPNVFDQVQGSEELWFVVNALEAMIFLMMISLKDPKNVARTRQDFAPYEAQFINQTAVETFNNALKSQDGMERAKQSLDSIGKAADKISNTLSGTSCSEGIRTNIVDSFKRGSILLSAANSENDHWWCHCTGLKILC